MEIHCDAERFGRFFDIARYMPRYMYERKIDVCDDIPFISPNVHVTQHT